MKLSDKSFFSDKLDLTIPELKRAAELYESGDEPAACKAFSDFIKKTIRADILLSIPYKPQEGIPSGYTEKEYYEMILEGYVYSVGFLHKFEGGRIIWDHNPTYNGYIEFGFHLNYTGEFAHLATAYRESGDERFARRFVDMMSSWLEQTECPGKVVGDSARPCWRSIDSANRMYGAWPRAVCSFLHSPSVSDRMWVDIFKSIWEHSYRLIGLNTKFNWHTNEINGVLTSALLYPFFRESAEWYEWCIDEAKKQIDNEFYSDGFQAELCTGYQFGVIAHFRAIERLLRYFDKPVPEKFYEGYRVLLSPYFKLADPTGQVTPNNDSGGINIKTVANRALEIFPNDPFYTWFNTDGKEGTPPDFTSIVLPYSGFAVIRSSWEKNAFFAMLDSGPEGTAHIHEDKLNLIMTAYGEEMLDDIGFYAYDTSDMRYFAVGTRSHNSGLVDGYGQNRSATHRWAEGIDVENTQTPAFGEYVDLTALADVKYRNSEKYELMGGVYSGDYGPELVKAEHCRRVIFFKHGLGEAKPFFLLLDSFKSLDGKEHTYEVSFQHRALPVTVKDRAVITTYESGATLTTLSTVCPNILVGQYSPRYVGWRPIHGPEEHEHLPSPFVSFEKRGYTADYATLLYPAPSSKTPEFTLALEGEKLTISVNGEKYSFDVILIRKAPEDRKEPLVLLRKGNSSRRPRSAS